MYCTKCGEELKDEYKICPTCGMPIEGSEENSNKESKAVNKKKSRKVIIIVAAVVLLIVVLISGRGDAVSDIKSSTLPSYSEEITIGEAFEDFFDEPRWSTYESGDTDVVVFNGFVYSEAGDKIKVIMEMLMNKELLEWQEVTLYNVNDGTTTHLTDLELKSLLNAIYEVGTFSWSWY